MNPLSAKLRSSSDGDKLFVAFHCPGCDSAHVVKVSDGGWTWNGDADSPTFSPSVLVTRPANPDAIEGFEEFRKELRCHSFVRAGQIEFLSDCTHALAGKTVPMPDFPANKESGLRRCPVCGGPMRWVAPLPSCEPGHWECPTHGEQEPKS